MLQRTPLPHVDILCGDALSVLGLIPDKFFDCCVTSPPYFGLRDYGCLGQIGLETTMQDYIATIVRICREIRRVLKKEGTFWLNVGDSYASNPRGNAPSDVGRSTLTNPRRQDNMARGQHNKIEKSGLRAKQLLMIPSRLAIALQDDGWYVRSEIIWHKPNPMPESVRDRPTNAHEKVWFLTKSASYFYDADAIRNPPAESFLKEVAEGYSGRATKDFAAGGAQYASVTKTRIIERAREKIDKQRGHGRRHAGFNDRWDALTKDEQMALGSNARNVWSISPAPFRGAHFATFPPKLVETCLKAGCPPGGLVLDPFGGSGTTAVVARQLGMFATLIELNPAYIEIARQRLGVGT